LLGTGEHLLSGIDLRSLVSMLEIRRGRACHTRLPAEAHRMNAASSMDDAAIETRTETTLGGRDILDFKLFATVFVSIFVAELGDKTQLATLLYASDTSRPKLTVFAASASALVVTSAIGVLAGTLVSSHVSPKLVRWIAGNRLHRRRDVGPSWRANSAAGGACMRAPGRSSFLIGAPVRGSPRCTQDRRVAGSATWGSKFGD
jgi:hypothetical protein